MPENNSTRMNLFLMSEFRRCKMDVDVLNTDTISQCIQKTGFTVDDDCDIFINGLRVSPADIMTEYHQHGETCWITIVNRKIKQDILEAELARMAREMKHSSAMDNRHQNHWNIAIVATMVSLVVSAMAVVLSIIAMVR